MDRQQLRARGAFTAVEFLRIKSQDIHAEPYRTLGITGAGIENKVLRPLLSFVLWCGWTRVGGVDEVAIDVRVAQVERAGCTLDETAIFIGMSRSRHACTECQGQAEQCVMCGYVTAKNRVMHEDSLAVNYYFFGGFLQRATEFQAQAALATICRETAV
ncbi:hypothetical protein D3C76_1254090 [compost metagenome]